MVIDDEQSLCDFLAYYLSKTLAKEHLLLEVRRLLNPATGTGFSASPAGSHAT